MFGFSALAYSVLRDLPPFRWELPSKTPVQPASTTLEVPIQLAWSERPLRGFVARRYFVGEFLSATFL